MWENWDPIKKHEETVKTGMGNSSGNANKKNYENKPERFLKKRGAEISGENKEQATQEKISVQLEEINKKMLAKEGRLKRYRQRVKQ